MTETINDFSGKYSWLSNFQSSPITYKGLTYPTVEHAYQAQKNLSESYQQAIQETDGARNAKFLGRRVILRKDWEEIKDQVMLDCVRLKFNIRPLGVLLLDTGDAEIIEGNYWGDTYWGVCRNVGLNKLGKILMQVRQELKNKMGDH